MLRGNKKRCKYQENLFLYNRYCYQCRYVDHGVAMSPYKCMHIDLHKHCHAKRNMSVYTR